MTSRAALLPTPGTNPFLISYWLRHFESWAEHIDTLYVDISWPTQDDVRERVVRDCEAVGASVSYYTGKFERDHGQALNEMLARVKEDTVMLVEDDFYVNDPAIIPAQFERIESGEYDAVGVPRGSMSAVLQEHAGSGWGAGDEGSLCPWMLFTSTFTLRRLGWLGATHWYAGDKVPGLEIRLPDEASADTFGAAAFMLRSFDARVFLLPKPDDDGPYMHVGSLSSGPFNAEVQHGEASWTRRLEWWRRFSDAWPGGLDDYKAAYDLALANVERALA